MTISIKWSGARVERYVSTAITSLGESLINVVSNDKPKMLTGMKQIAITVDLNTQKPDTATSLTGASSHTGDEWHDINWRKVHQNVRRLQARIVKATQEVVYMLRNRV